MKSSFLLACGASLLAFATSLSRADEVHYDVFVTSSGTSLVIGGYNDVDTVADIPAGQLRVFGGEVTGTGTSAYVSPSPGEPGFRASTQTQLNNPSLTTPANTYTALSGSTALTFTFEPVTVGAQTRNLFFWDGAGSVAFAPVAGNVVLGLTKGAVVPEWTQTINGDSAGVIAGNTIQSTGATGSIHTHLFTSIAEDGGAPGQGFYLYSLRLHMNGYSSSDPIYFVYGALDPANLAPQFADLAAFETAHGQAELWVESNLVAVPEPSSVVLGGLGAAGLGWLGLRRRRGGRGRFTRST